MKIVIIGCGRVGSKLACQLAHEGNDVAVIDRNPLAFDKLQNNLAVNMIVGTGIDEDVMINAGVKDADAVISVAKGDNTNIMAGQIAKFLFNVPKVIVRIVDPKSKKFYEDELGLTCYCPTEVSSNNYLKILGGI
ncbi:MAG: NAD-binding protein [Clostridia bacterium]|nr:NAD-binding protein [Clostridia bacterium]